MKPKFHNRGGSPAVLSPRPALPEAPKKAFTLIELLVVICIISLLAAICFPVFSRARENAKRASCQSNLRLIGLALVQYTQDFDERYPLHDPTNAFTSHAVQNYATTNKHITTWLMSLQPYCKSFQLFHCPSAGWPASNFPSGNNDCSYFLNGVIIGRSNAVVPNPAEIIFLHETKNRSNILSVRPVLTSSNPKGYWAWMRPGYDDVHFGGANFVFCDGHVKYRSRDTVRPSEFGVNVPGDAPGDNLTITDANPVPALF